MEPVKILLLISEMEGACTHTKNLGFTEDHKVLREMCDRYYALYFKLKREQHNPKCSVAEPPTVNRLVAGSNPALGVTDWNTSVLTSPREKRIGIQPAWERGGNPLEPPLLTSRDIPPLD